MDATGYKNRMRRVVTQYLYEQQKFNLLREENEGFAKIMVELNQPNISLTGVEVVKKNIEALIGYFSLDPNRVLDIILDSFENNVGNDAYIELLKDNKTKRSAIAQVLGFKFQSFHDLMDKRDKSLPVSQARNLVP